MRLCSWYNAVYFASSVTLLLFCSRSSSTHQNALKGEDSLTPHKKDNPGKKRKNNKKSKSRKRCNAAPDKEVISNSVSTWVDLEFQIIQMNWNVLHSGRLGTPVILSGLKTGTCTLLLFPQLIRRRAPVWSSILIMVMRRSRTSVIFWQRHQIWMKTLRKLQMDVEYDTAIS